MKSAGKARNNGLYRHIRTSKEIIRNLLNDLYKNKNRKLYMILNMCLVICNDKWYTTKSFIKNLK